MMAYGLGSVNAPHEQSSAQYTKFTGLIGSLPPWHLPLRGHRPYFTTNRATPPSIAILNVVQSSQTATLFPAPSVRHENGRTLVALVQPARPFRRFTQATTSAAGMRVRRTCSCRATYPAFASQRHVAKTVVSHIIEGHSGATEAC